MARYCAKIFSLWRKRSMVCYMYPGLHPDDYKAADGGWPRVLKRFAAEAFRRAENGEINDDELYCFEASNAQLVREYGVMRLESAEKPWRFTDHFAV